MKIRLTETCLKRIIKKVIHKKFIYESEQKYPVLNRPRSMGQAYKANMLGEMKFIPENVLFTTLTEGVDWDIPVEERGGIITFATTVNSVDLDSRRLMNVIKKKSTSIINMLTVNKKIDNIAKKHNLVGLTLGHFLTGKYLDRRKVKDEDSGEIKTITNIFDDKSLSLELVGITYEQLIKIAEDMCIEFKQDSVLVKSYENGKILFVYNDELRNTNNKFYKLKN